jgi:hypothetical protein
MILIDVKINEGPEGKTKRFLEACQIADEVVCRYWAENYLPVHFQRGAHAKYNYAPRTSKYLNRRDKRGKPDLVYTGRSRDLLTNKGNARFKTSKGQSSFDPIVGGAIRYFWMTPTKQPNKPKEMKVVSADELRKLTKIFHMVVLSEMAKEPGAEKPNYAS